MTVTGQDGVYSVITEFLTLKSVTALSLTKGVIYDFKVQARNAHGYSGFSDTFSILCAIRPGIPSNILTVNSNENVVISWTAPTNNGSPITAYTILIETNIGTFVEEPNNCVGSDAIIVSSLTCTVTLADL